MRDSQQLSISTLSLSRATLCEILAIRVLRELWSYGRSGDIGGNERDTCPSHSKLKPLGGWSERSLALATVLLTPWAIFQGASKEITERAKEEDEDVLDNSANALEVSSSLGIPAHASPSSLTYMAPRLAPLIPRIPDNMVTG